MCLYTFHIFLTVTAQVCMVGKMMAYATTSRPNVPVGFILPRNKMYSRYYKLPVMNLARGNHIDQSPQLLN